MGKIAIIIQREFYQRVRKRSFIITTILTPLLLVAVMVVPIALMSLKSDKTREIVVIDHSGIVASHLTSTSNIVFMPETASFEEVRARDNGIFGILVVGENVIADPKAVQLYTFESSTVDLEMAVAGQINKILEIEKLKGYDIDDLPQIISDVKTNVSMQSYRIDQNGGEKANSSALSMGLAYMFGFLIYMFVFIYGGMVMQGVIEEKSSRVMEIMVSSVKPFELMMGKILGIAMVAITQFLIWVAVIAVAGGVLTAAMAGNVAVDAARLQDGLSPSMMGGVSPGMFDALNTITDPAYLLTIMGAFIAFFIGGYLLYAAMFAAIGSAVDNTADSQQLQVPVTIPIVVALIVMMSVMKEPGSSLAVWFSMIPFTSPVIMMARIPYGVPAWEIALSLAILYASFIAMVWFAAKIYRVGIFMYGKKPSLREMLKWSRYKY